MRKLIALLVAMMLVLTLAPAMAEEPIEIGVVYKQPGNPFFEAAVKGFTEAVKSWASSSFTMDLPTVPPKARSRSSKATSLRKWTPSPSPRMTPLPSFRFCSRP